MTVLGPVVVVGASVAGLRTAERLRGHGYDGPITLVGAESHLPYERPPLSKQLLSGALAPAAIGLKDRAAVAALDLDLRLGVRATALDPATKTVALDDGSTVSYGTLVVATGLTPRRLPAAVCPADVDGVLTLRTLDDALALQQRLVRGSRLVVVGGGLIGCEVAATARSLGVAVTIVEADTAPMARALGTELGGVLAELHRGHGVELRLGLGVEAVESAVGGDGTRRVTGVRLAGGETVPADTVLVAIGATPNTAWLEGSGLDLGDGVACDDTGHTDLPDVLAVGDIARWHRPLYGRALRFEHWTNATEQADIVAALLTGASAPAVGAPYAWSDQYDVRLQLVGVPALGPATTIRRSERQVLATFGDGDRLVGAFGMNAPRHVLHARRLVAAGVEPDAAWDALPALA